MRQPSAMRSHAGLKVNRPAEAPPRIAAVLARLVGVDQRAARSPSAHGHQDRIEHDLAVNGRACGPSDDPRKQIHDDGQVEPALPRPNVGDIR